MEKEETTFHSYDEFRRDYFPKACEQERIEKMTDEERGEYLAAKTIEKIADRLSKLF